MQASHYVFQVGRCGRVLRADGTLDTWPLRGRGEWITPSLFVEWLVSASSLFVERRVFVWRVILISRCGIVMQVWDCGRLLIQAFELIGLCCGQLGAPNFRVQRLCLQVQVSSADGGAQWLKIRLEAYVNGFLHCTLSGYVYAYVWDYSNVFELWCILLILRLF